MIYNEEYDVYRVKITDDMRPRGLTSIKEWTRGNIGPSSINNKFNWMIIDDEILFRNQEDAFLFQLTWS